MGEQKDDSQVLAATLKGFEREIAYAHITFRRLARPQIAFRSGVITQVHGPANVDVSHGNCTSSEAVTASDSSFGLHWLVGLLHRLKRIRDLGESPRRCCENHREHRLAMTYATGPVLVGLTS